MADYDSTAARRELADLIQRHFLPGDRNSLIDFTDMIFAVLAMQVAAIVRSADDAKLIADKIASEFPAAVVQMWHDKQAFMERARHVH